MVNKAQNQRIEDLVIEAQKAVIESQGNTDPGKYQHAQNAIQEAKLFLKESFKPTDSVEEKQLQHAKELLKHLEETLHAIQSIE